MARLKISKMYYSVSSLRYHSQFNSQVLHHVLEELTVITICGVGQ